MLMDLFIETLTGVSFGLRVSPAETVMSIKSKIQRAEGIPITQQHLIWQNGELDDHRRLRDYSISAGSTIRLVLGLRGGPLNAHRIPPLRLTPIQLTPAAPSSSLLPRIHRMSSASTRLTQLSRFHFPALCSTGFSSDSTPGLQQNGSTLSPSSETLVNLSQSEASTSSATIGRNPRATSDTPSLSRKPTTKSSLGSSPRLAGPFSSEEVHNHVDPSSDQPSKPSCSTAEPSQYHSSPLASRKEDTIVKFPSSQPDVCDSAVDDPPSFGSVNGPCSTKSADSASPQTTSRQTPAALDYPPLFPLSGSSRPSFSSFDVSPYWRLYEPSRITTLPKSFTRNLFSVASTPEPGRDSPPSAAPVDCDSRKLTVPKSEGNCTLDGEESSSPTTGTETNAAAAAAAATLLAGILSSSGDRLDFPIQTSGNERTTICHPRYPYHWIRRTTPLNEDGEVQHRLITSGSFWDPDEVGEDCDLLYNMFDAETERDDDDVDEDDDGEGEDDESVEARGAYDGEMDDDDSLADLEDYLFYYRTGDLLFGPPSLTSICPPYFYAVRDTFGTESEADFGVYTTRTMKDSHPVGQRNEKSWREECSQLAEKVNDLKNKMNELRIRRQHRQKVRSHEQPVCERTVPERNSETQDSPNKPLNITSQNVLGSEIGKSESSSNTLPVAVYSSEAVISSNQSVDAKVLQETAGTSSPEPSQVSNPRRRRFATVTPPKFLSLLRSSQQDFTTEPTDSGVQSSAVARIPSTVSSDNQFTRSIPAPLSPLPRDRNRRSFYSVLRPLSSSTSCQSREAPTLVGKSSCSLLSTPEYKPPIHFRSSLLSHSLGVSNSSGNAVRPQTSAVPVTSGSRILPELTERPRPLVSSGELPVVNRSTSVEKSILPAIPTTSGKSEPSTVPKSPPRPTYSPSSSMRRKRCALCLRRTGLVNSYSCRCGRNFCSRHRYAEVHTCPFDYKAEGRQALIDANPVVTASKLPKI